MSTPYQNEERRFALRMALRLPIVVSGRSDDGAAWSEPTETDDISTSGALFHLNQKVSVGEKLYIRAHKPDGSPTEATATVVRLSPAIYGTARVGVQIAENHRLLGRAPFLSPDELHGGHGVLFLSAYRYSRYRCRSRSQASSVTQEPGCSRGRPQTGAGS